ncbi:MAG: TVP38/TMEM64 family protein [Hyphomicrobiaceae bacterium]
MSPDNMKKPAATGTPKRFLPLIVLAAIMASVFAMGWHRHLTLDNIAANRDALRTLIDRHQVLAILAYVGLYAAAIALSLPGGAVMTMAGGLLFGWLAGGFAAIVAATIGATVVFLVAKTALGETLAEKAGPWLVKLREGFQDNALSYLLFLRLVPAFPFWLVNLAPALLGVTLGTYVLGTFVGIVPGTLAFASVGAGLDSVIAAAQADFAACVAAKGASACKLTVSAGSLITKELLLAFALLGMAALIPVALKKWSKRHATAA